MIKTVCVFSSSSSAVDSIYRDTAVELGKKLGEDGFDLVFGGADAGLMGVIARTVQKNGTRVIGVIPRSLAEKGIAYQEADELIISNNLRDRKEIIESRSDAFIALPGGFGTMEEIMEILTLKQLQLHSKPIVFINTNNYYDNLIAQFETGYQENFAKKEFKELYYVSKSAEDTIDYIKHYTPKQLPGKWF
ncbi:MAG: TIGR00730 family Rossman fold protein [Candidatus Methanoperedens sp.]|nr:TIGR00730 family Rossman fold protein [Candidatus Methanoperedens sp.]